MRHSYQIPFIKVGHAGTLDPLASGLLIICIGKTTKKLEDFQGLEKEYTGTIMLGATTPSYDFETPVSERYPIAHLTHALIHEAAKKFVGTVWQYPPDFSAKKIQGDRAYNIARSGGQPDIKPVLVTISKFEIVSILLPMIEFKVVCGKGTYIRSLAHDLGRQLGCGGILASLCRTRIGKYKLKDASETSNWMEAVQPVAPKKRIPVRTARKKMKERAKERKKLAKSSSTPAQKATKRTKKSARKQKVKGKKKK